MKTTYCFSDCPGTLCFFRKIELGWIPGMHLKVWISHWQITSVVSGSRSIPAKTISEGVELYFYPELCWHSCVCAHTALQHIGMLFALIKGPGFEMGRRWL